jgi:uncharacterized membrane-anchored protein
MKETCTAKSTPSSRRISGALRWIQTGEPCGENPFKHGFVPPGPVVSGIRLRLLPWTQETEKEVDRFDPASLCYSLVENGSASL